MDTIYIITSGCAVNVTGYRTLYGKYFHALVYVYVMNYAMCFAHII